MTKLYYGPAGAAAELWWQLPGKQRKGAERIDVPSSPAELADWLNERGVPSSVPYPGVDCEHGFDACPKCDERPAQLASVPPGMAVGENGALTPDFRPRLGGDPSQRCAACNTLLCSTPEGAISSATSADLTAVEEWVQSITIDRLWALKNLAEAIREQAAALGAEWDGRTVQ